jgi:hypothetical protein
VGVKIDQSRGNYFSGNIGDRSGESRGYVFPDKCNMPTRSCYIKYSIDIVCGVNYPTSLKKKVVLASYYV